MAKPATVTRLAVEERQRLREQWKDLVCEWCHHAHLGQCTRVREVVRTFHPNGTLAMERVKLWHRWEPPADAIAPDELGDGKVAK